MTDEGGGEGGGAAAGREPEAKVGIECRKCGCTHFNTVDIRPAWGGRIRRRRECRYCGQRVTTYEKVVGDTK